MAARRKTVLMALYVFLAGAAASAPRLPTAAPVAAVSAAPAADLTMAPHEFTSVTVLRSQEQPFPPILQSGFVPMAQPLIATRADVRPPQPQPQLYHSPPPALGHTRPFQPSPPIPVTPKYHPHPPPHALPHPRARPDARSPTQRSFDAALLGSGDFGVLRGGTFYPEEEMPYHPEDNSDFGDFYGEPGGGGGGGPAHSASEGFVEKYTYPEEQFAQFRDFADLKTPAEGAFSQFLVVYAAKNATRPGDQPQPPPQHPRNIFEQLELLDREKALEEKEKAKKTEREEQKEKKSSKSKAKAKLAKTKLQKRYRKKKPSAKELDYEPLLALS